MFASIDCERCGATLDVKSVEYFDKRLLCSDCRSLKAGYGTCKNCIRYSIVERKCTFDNIEKGEDNLCDTVVRVMHY